MSDIPFYPLQMPHTGSAILDLVRNCIILFSFPAVLSVFSFLLFGASISDVWSEGQGDSAERSQEANLENDLKVLVDLKEKTWRRAHTY